MLSLALVLLVAGAPACAQQAVAPVSVVPALQFPGLSGAAAALQSAAAVVSLPGSQEPVLSLKGSLPSVSRSSIMVRTAALPRSSVRARVLSRVNFIAKDGDVREASKAGWLARLRDAHTGLLRAKDAGGEVSRVVLEKLYTDVDAEAGVVSAEPEPSPIPASDVRGLDAFVALSQNLFFPDLKPGQKIAVAKPAQINPQGIPSDDDMNRDMVLSPLTNPEREQAGIQLFQAGGAADKAVVLEPGKPVPLDLYDTVMIQDAGKKRNNIFVVKRGKTDRIVVVGAHHDRVSFGPGSGTIDNWTGTTMVTNLYKAVRDMPADATFVFVLFSREEEGLLGSRYWLDSLSEAQRKRIAGMVNLDTLAVDGTYSWRNNSDKAMLEAVQRAAKQEKLDLEEVTFYGGDADSSSFRRKGIPAMTLFGASEDVIWDIVHSARDTIAAFSFPNYKNAYLLTLALLKRLQA